MIDKKLTGLAPHTFVVLVNKVTQAASEYAGMGQLRERIASAVSEFVKPCPITKTLATLESEHPRTLYAVEVLEEVVLLKVPRGLNMASVYVQLDRQQLANRTIPTAGHSGPDYDTIYIRTGHQSLFKFEEFCSKHRAALMYSLNAKEPECSQ